MVKKERSALAGLFNALSFFADATDPRRERRLLIGALLLYVLVTISLLFRHEVSHDEAQAWLIARDTPTLGSMLNQMRYEGSGGLWHLLLRPFARAGASFYWIYVLNFLCCTATVFLLAARSPLPLWMRVLLPFTYLFVWEYSIFARSYALGVLFLVAATHAWRARPERFGTWTLLLILSANCNLPSLILAGGFFITLLLGPKQKGTSTGLLLLAIGFALTMVYVWPTADSSVSLQFYFRPDHFTRMLTGLPRFGFVVYVALTILLVHGGRNRAVTLGFVAGQVALLIFFSLVPICDTRHYLFLLVGMLWMLWLGNVEWGLALKSFFVLVILSMVARGIYRAAGEARVHNRFPQQLAAAFEREPGRRFIVADPPSASVPVAVFLPKDSCYFPFQDRWGTFVTWDKTLGNHIRRPIPSLAALARQHPGYDGYYLVTLWALPQDSLRAMQLILLSETHQGANAPVARDARDRYLYRLAR